jgi:hypothetical protein
MPRGTTVLYPVHAGPKENRPALGSDQMTPQSHTARSALAVARAAYADFLLAALSSSSDDRFARVAVRAYERGLAQLAALDSETSDFALSADASDLFATYVSSLGTNDPSDVLLMLDMFPDLMRLIPRDGQVPVRISVQNQPVSRELQRSDADPVPSPGEEDYRDAANKQSTLALAA